MEGTDTISGYAANPLFTNGAAHVTVSGGGVALTPSNYDTDLTVAVAGTPIYLQLATGTKLVNFFNRSATGLDARVVFGTSEANCLDNFTVGAGDFATTGYYLPAAAQGGAMAGTILRVPSSATHCAVLNATTLQVTTVAVTQGV